MKGIFFSGAIALVVLPASFAVAEKSAHVEAVSNVNAAKPGLSTSEIIRSWIHNADRPQSEPLLNLLEIPDTNNSEYAKKQIQHFFELASYRETNAHTGSMSPAGRVWCGFPGVKSAKFRIEAGVTYHRSYGFHYAKDEQAKQKWEEEFHSLTADAEAELDQEMKKASPDLKKIDDIAYQTLGSRASIRARAFLLDRFIESNDLDLATAYAESLLQSKAMLQDPWVDKYVGERLTKQVFFLQHAFLKQSKYADARTAGEKFRSKVEFRLLENPDWTMRAMRQGSTMSDLLFPEGVDKKVRETVRSFECPILLALAGGRTQIADNEFKNTFGEFVNTVRRVRSTMPEGLGQSDVVEAEYVDEREKEFLSSQLVPKLDIMARHSERDIRSAGVELMATVLSHDPRVKTFVSDFMAGEQDPVVLHRAFSTVLGLDLSLDEKRGLLIPYLSHENPEVVKSASEAAMVLEKKLPRVSSELGRF